MDQHRAPKSSTAMWINTTGLCVSFGILLFVNIFKPLISPVTLTVCCLLGYALPVILLEWVFLKTHKNTSTGLDFSAPPKPVNLQRVAIKLLGLYSTYALIFLVYWLFPEYDKFIYFHFLSLLKTAGPILIVIAIPYFLIIDRYMVQPNDSYWQMGQLCLLNFDRVQYKHILQHCLGWLVKLFFLPMMYGYLFQRVLYFQAVEFSVMFNSFKHFFDTSFSLLIFVDLLVGTVGYILTVRLFDSHIRTTEPTFFGWFIAIICYQPVSTVIWTTYLAYRADNNWIFWFSDYPTLFVIWGLLILGFKSIYVWATFSFGIRFSNLTHRGIITNGPYKYCKHPAYVCKNITWWLISLPFLSTVSAAEAVRLCLLLLIVNFIYFMRARTEERHLSWDKDYIAYADYIEKHGLLAFVGQRLPVLKFKQHRLFNLAD